MLVDDNPDDNFFHERVIRKFDATIRVVVMESAKDALQHLRDKHLHEELHPDLIFLDINMPAMNGWEFLDEYRELDALLQDNIVVIMLTTSDNPDDRERAKLKLLTTEFLTKPLTKEMLVTIKGKYFLV